MKSHRTGLSRRTFLRGVGVSMALPWMESLRARAEESAAAASGTKTQPGDSAPIRTAVLFSGNGFHTKEWWAKGEGSAMELGLTGAAKAVDKNGDRKFDTIQTGTWSGTCSYAGNPAPLAGATFFGERM